MPGLRAERNGVRSAQPPATSYDAAMGSMVVDAFGSRIRVDAADTALNRLRNQWARCVVDDGLPHDGVVRHGPGPAVDTDYPLSTAVTLAAITAQTGRTLMVHACGVADPDSGRVATLVAPSGAGKTTAATTLTAAGLGYVSDETVAIDVEGTVCPYPKPLSRVIEAHRPYRKQQLSPDALGLARPVQRRLVPGPFVLLRRDPERTAPPQIEALDLLDAMLQIIPQTSALPSLPRPLAALANAITAGGGAFALDYAEITDCIELVHGLFRMLDRSNVEVEHLPPPAPLSLSGAPDRDIALGALAPQTTLRRTSYTDAIAQDGRMILLRGPEVCLLDGIGSILWRHCSEFTPLALLQDACVAEAGEHPDAERLVADAVVELVGNAALTAG